MTDEQEILLGDEGDDGDEENELTELPGSGDPGDDEDGPPSGSSVPGSRLYVGKFPGNTQLDESKFSKSFGAFGTVTEISIKSTPDGSQYAFVNYDSSDSASKALDALNNTDFEGTKISISLARERGGRRGRGRGRGGRRGGRGASYGSFRERSGSGPRGRGRGGRRGGGRGRGRRGRRGN